MCVSWDSAPLGFMFFDLCRLFLLSSRVANIFFFHEYLFLCYQLTVFTWLRFAAFMMFPYRIKQILLRCFWVLFQCSAILTLMIKLNGFRMLFSTQFLKGSTEQQILAALHQQVISQKQYVIIFEDRSLHIVSVVTEGPAKKLAPLIFLFCRCICTRIFHTGIRRSFWGFRKGFIISSYPTMQKLTVSRRIKGDAHS